MKMFSNKELRNMIITLFFEQLLVMLVGIVDTFVVSSCGEAAVSGVSLVNQFNTIFIYLFTALASGGAIVVSQYIGNKDKERTILSSSQLLNVMFDHCDLQEASFYDANFKKIQFNETNLIQSELASLHHKGLDLSTCQIQGAMFDLASLKGLIINDFQAVDLIGILGVKVK